MSLLARTSTVTAATLGSRVMGFARDAGTAAVLGAGPAADALMAALSLPLLARRLLAEGAFNAAFLPGLATARARGGDAAGGALSRAVLILLVALLLVLAGLGALFMPALIGVLAPGFALGGERADLAVACGRIALLYLPLAAGAAVFGGIANAGQRVFLPALAPGLANAVVLCVILYLVLAADLATGTAAVLVAIAQVAAGIAQLALMKIASLGAPGAPSRAQPGGSDWRGARSVLRACAPALLFAGLSQFRLLIAAATVSALPGAVAALNYAQRLVDLPLGLVGASAGAVLVPLLAAGGAGRGRHASGASLAALALALPAGTGLAVLAEPIVAVLYQRGSFDAEDARLTALLLAALAFSLPAQGLERVLSATALTHGMTRTVERVGLASLLACVLACIGLGAAFGPAGAASGVAVSASFSALTIGTLLARAGHLHVDGALARAVAGLAGGCVLMALVVGGLAQAWPHPGAGTFAALGRLVVLVGAGMLSYGVVALLVRRLLRRATG
ncbi:MAG TPA: lipid II flippase MurJ [Xanthobacteraceae bacterium]|jgi:putative peptidoglycan lipid II flippase|nr:lipid II flippase MurJ [Xanthobacteraceae bacterium]HQS48075.1 lipid II flippase MurJ [Xanthobacteraceae bacterium]